jgi:hypothetical protein
MSELFEFEWGVDQSGYEIAPRKRGALSTASTLFDLSDDPDGDTGGGDYDHEIRRRGGPLRYYRPMTERPGLWRRCAETCISWDGALEFVNEFGLFGLFDKQESSESIGFILNTGRYLAAIADQIDKGDRDGAAQIFNSSGRTRLAAMIVPAIKGRRKIHEFRLAPLTLRGALHLQVGEAITGDRRLKRCRNCPEWFPVGTGAATARRDFCSDRCRVAWSRKTRHVASIAT